VSKLPVSRRFWAWFLAVFAPFGCDGLIHRRKEEHPRFPSQRMNRGPLSCSQGSSFLLSGVLFLALSSDVRGTHKVSPPRLILSGFESREEPRSPCGPQPRQILMGEHILNAPRPVVYRLSTPEPRASWRCLHPSLAQHTLQRRTKIVERRLRRFNMTLASLPQLSTEDSGDSDDSEEDEVGDIRGAGGGAAWSVGVSRSEGGRGRRPGSRRKRAVTAECPFDREEILQIWAR